MKRTYISDLSTKIGKKVLIKGFIQAKQIHKNITFLKVRDKTGIIQVVIHPKPKIIPTSSITLESVVAITGIVNKVDSGKIDISASTLTILSHAHKLPIPVVSKRDNETKFAKRLQYRWIDLRKPDKKLILELWTELERGFRSYYEKKGYIQIYSPSLIKFPIEEGAVLFEVDYFGKKALLSQSQFYKQMAMAAGLEKMFSVGPIFRAEKSFTTRHLAEFTGWDFETSFINSHQDLIREIEGLLVSGFRNIKKKLPVHIIVPKRPFPQITLGEAKKRLRQNGITNKESQDALSPTEEKVLGKMMKDKTGHDFLIITDYPRIVRPYYYMQSEKDPTLSKSFDVLYKGIEIASGAQREHRYDVVVKSAREFDVDIKLVAPYLDYFKYGCPPHGGAGIGPARIIMGILNLKTIKEAVFLPRDVTKLTP